LEVSLRLKKCSIFCGKKQILSDVEVISINQINDAYERMQKRDIKYRFVIDLKSFA